MVEDAAPSAGLPRSGSEQGRGLPAAAFPPGRLVVKLGSALLTNEGRGLDQAAIGTWANQVARLIEKGTEVALVSSGSIAEGMRRLGWRRRPRALGELQAAAAVGQMGLVQAYETEF